MSIGKCKLCGKNKELIEAHIVPQTFNLKNQLGLYSSDTSFQKRPKGSYDRNMLCSSCDGGALGELDDYAKGVLVDKNLCRDGDIDFYTLDDINGYSKLYRFFLSVLWRASVSSLHDYRMVSLGGYEDIVKEAVLSDDFMHSDRLSVAVCCWEEKDHSPIHLFAERKKIAGINTWFYFIANMKVAIRVDRRKWDGNLEYISLHQKRVVMGITKFAKLKEAKGIPGFLAGFSNPQKSRKASWGQCLNSG